MAESSETEVFKKWLRYAIFVRGSTTERPSKLIDFFKNLPGSSREQSRDAYWKASGVGLAAFALAIAFIGQPTQARAFWPFSIASADAAGSPIVHDPSLPLLQAATNSDPNPTKLVPELALSDDAVVPNQGPDGGWASVASSTPSDNISVYVVRPGDTLADVAKLFDVSVNTIVWANDLGSSKAIHVGETLIILPISGIQHTVASGETIQSIAKKFSGDANEIAEFNGLDPEAPLNVGDTIIIPGGELASVSPGTTKKPRTGGRNPYRGGSGAEVDDYYANPVPGDRVTQGLHGENAVDLGAPRGSLIHASADGTVIITRNGGWNGGYGSYVVIAHDNGTQTLYAHMITGSIAVAPGENVSQGDVIGEVGMTGDATGPHVHFEVRGAMNLFAACPLGSYPGEFACN